MKCLSCAGEVLGDICEYCGSEVVRQSVIIQEIHEGPIDREQVRKNLIEIFDTIIYPTLRKTKQMEDYQTPSPEKSESQLESEYAEDCMYKPHWLWIITGGAALFGLLFGLIIGSPWAVIFFALIGYGIQFVTTKAINVYAIDEVKSHRGQAERKYNEALAQLNIEKEMYKEQLKKHEKEKAEFLRSSNVRAYLEIIPEDFRNDVAIDEIYNILKSNRADNLKEAFNQYNTLLHQKQIEETQQEQLRIQQQQLETQQQQLEEQRNAQQQQQVVKVKNQYRMGGCGCLPVIGLVVLVAIILFACVS